MLIVVFAAADVPASTVEKLLRQEHARAEICIVPVKHQTAEQISGTLQGKQYDAVYLAELVNGEVTLSNLFTASALRAQLAATVLNRLTNAKSQAVAPPHDVAKTQEKGVPAPAPFVMVFAPRSASETAIHDYLRALHPTAEIGLALVKHSSREAIREAIEHRQPNVLYMVQNTDVGELRYTDLSQGRLQTIPTAQPRPVAADALDAFADTLHRTLTTPNSEDPDGAPTRRSCRKLLELLFPKHSDLETFIEGNYPSVARRLSPQMDRTSKVTLVLQLTPTEELLVALAKNSQFQNHRHLLTYELRVSRVWRPASETRAGASDSSSKLR